MTTILFSPPLPTSIMDMCRAMLPPGYELLAGERKDPEFARALPEAEFWMGFARGGLDEAFFKTGKRLKLVQLISAGYDAIDMAAARRSGIPVCNNGGSNSVSVAEHTLMLILAVLKRLTWCHGNVVSSKWRVGGFDHVPLHELEGKTVGIVGLGRIGALVSARLLPFGVKLLAYDPYVQAGKAAQIGAQLVSLDELLAESDFITVHMPKTPETLGLIGEESLRKVKPTARIINVARGGLVDEAALATAIKEGRVAGAGIDVYAKEPCTDSPLFELDQVVVTPHLGASTEEAQEKAGVSVARSVRQALGGELVPDAVNIQGGIIAEDVRPGVPLAEKLGRLFTHLAGGAAQQLDVVVAGEITQHDVKVLELSALKGVFADITESPVSFVNAPYLAQERGLEVRLTTTSESPDYRNLVTVRGTLASGEIVEVSGTVSGKNQVHRIVDVNGFTVDVGLDEHTVFFRYTDRPGVIGTLGRILGEAGVNIAGMQVSRNARGGEALVSLTVDSKVSAELLGQITESIGATWARTADLGD